MKISRIFHNDVAAMKRLINVHLVCIHITTKVSYAFTICRKEIHISIIQLTNDGEKLKGLYRLVIDTSISQASVSF